jgi:hypothetical protein
MLNRPGRYRRLRQLSTLDPVADCHAIYRATTLYEFPFEAKIGLLLAFWRTFAIPSIAQLLVTTGETTERTARRTDDTGILMYELIDHGLDQIHRRYPISNDDHRYVLGTFIVTATRFIDRAGWRPLSDLERQATYHFYAELGRRMNIHDIPPDLDAYTTFFDGYEARHLAHTPAAERLMDATRGLLGTMLPRPLAPAGPPLLAALLDEPLRRATAPPPPSRTARATLTTALTVRGFLLRHLYPPRRHSSLAAGINATTYPDGYDLTTVGPPTPAEHPTDTPGATPPRTSRQG